LVIRPFFDRATDPAAGMPRGNSLHLGNDFTSKEPPTLDLDPTTNDELYLTIWEKLKEKIQTQKKK
jgi:hypothetical protein